MWWEWVHWVYFCETSPYRAALVSTWEVRSAQLMYSFVHLLPEAVVVCSEVRKEG